MSQKESEWEEQLKRLQMALYVSVPADVAEDACKRINTIITAAVSTREKEIAEEVEKKVKTDFTNAWKVMVTKKENHHEKCSWRVAGMLCDCAGQDVFIETTKLFRDSVLQIIKH